MSVRSRASQFFALMGAGLLLVTADAAQQAAAEPAVALTARPVAAGIASRPTTAANRQAAIDDSARLLAGVIPPPGAVIVSRQSAVGAQRRVPLLTSVFASAVAAERWNVAGEPQAVLSYVQSHLLPGSKVLSTGSGGPDPSSQSVIRSWSPVRGVLDVRLLEIEVARAPSGGTALSAESQSQWVVVRSARERVPAGVTKVEVTKGVPGRPPQLTRRVTAFRAVRRLVALFDSLGIVQPGAINCPGETVDEPIVTVVFRAGTGRVLASATVDPAADFTWPDSVPGWACFSMGFVAGGRRYDPLIGNVISPIDHLLHVRLERDLHAP